MKKRGLIILIGLLTCGMVAAQDITAKRTKHYNLEKQNIAIQGYDPVSYFTHEIPTKGKREYTYTYKGILYWFSSLKNKRIFIENPDKHEPAYGGWCAYAMGVDGEKVKIDPKTYKLIRGKLYLFYNFGFTNTLKSWNKDQGKLEKQAILNWNDTIK